MAKKNKNTSSAPFYIINIGSEDLPVLRYKYRE